MEGGIKRGATRRRTHSLSRDQVYGLVVLPSMLLSTKSTVAIIDDYTGPSSKPLLPSRLSALPPWIDLVLISITL